MPLIATGLTMQAQLKQPWSFYSTSNENPSVFQQAKGFGLVPPDRPFPL